MPITESTDAPLLLLHEIAPDWERGVYNQHSYQNEVNRTRNGREQRINYRAKPRRTMAYSVPTARATADHLVATLGARAGAPLRIPWWPEGMRLAINMATVDEAQLEIAPGIAQGMDAGDTVLVGSAVRTIASRTEKVLTLAALGGSVQELAGAWVFPMRLAILIQGGAALSSVRHDKFEQGLRFEEI